jgi:hypothetical protein
MASLSPKRPTRVKVGPHVYKILYSKSSWQKYADKKKSNLVGLTIAEKGIILIKGNDSLNESQRRDTLLHEILHAAFALNSFKLMPMKLPDDYHDLEEIVILLHTPALLGVLRENPKVVDWLLTEDE